MITSTFDSVVEDGVTIGKRLSMYFNGKFISAHDFPPEAEMDQDQQDSYVAGKLSSFMG